MSSPLRRAHAFKLVITTTGCLAALASSALAADKNAFEGTVSVMATRASTGLYAFIASVCLGTTSTGTALSTSHNVNSF